VVVRNAARGTSPALVRPVRIIDVLAHTIQEVPVADSNEKKPAQPNTDKPTPAADKSTPAPELGVEELESVAGGIIDPSIVDESTNGAACGNVNKCNGVGL
jgi:hypothetical protein